MRLVLDFPEMKAAWTTTPEQLVDDDKGSAEKVSNHGTKISRTVNRTVVKFVCLAITHSTWCVPKPAEIDMLLLSLGPDLRFQNSRPVLRRVDVCGRVGQM